MDVYLATECCIIKYALIIWKKYKTDSQKSTYFWDKAIFQLYPLMQLFWARAHQRWSDSGKVFLVQASQNMNKDFGNHECCVV